MKQTKKPLQSLEDQMLRRVRGLGRGAVVSPGDFAKLGGRAAVDKALSRLAAAGRMRRVARGLYDIPRRNTRLGTTLPSVESVVIKKDLRV